MVTFRSNMERVVICGANAYEQKYYFNKDFDKIPDSMKDELHIICVLFTEEAGGIFTIGFDDEGELFMETMAEEEDITYDEIAAGMLVKQIRDNRQEMFEALSLYYRAIVLKEPIDSLLGEDGE